LELKVKKENFNLNEAQKAKLADKSRVINQIDDIKQYHDLFKST